MSNSNEIQAVANGSSIIEVLTYGQIESQRDPYGLLKLSDGKVGNVLAHQIVASNEAFLADFTHYGRIHPALDFAGDKLVMTVPRMGFDPDKGLMTPMPWLITSARELFPLSARELTARGLYSKVPIGNVLVPPRYSGEVLKGFLEYGWEGNLLDTFHLVKSTLEASLDLKDPRQYTFLSLWIIGTYMFQIFDAYPYIHFNGPKGVGKTTALEVLSKMCFNAELTPNISGPAQFRLIPSCSPTLLIDESEKYHRKSLEDERMILLSGYKRGGTVMRSVQGKGGWGNGMFEVYCPRGFASQNGFEDVMGSRTIKVLMSRSTRALKRLSPVHSEAIRDSLFLTAMTFASPIRDLYRQMDDPSGVVPFAGREYELFQPVLAIAVATGDPTIVAEATEFAIESHQGQLADFRETSLEHAYLSFLSEAEAEDAEYRGDVLLKAFEEYVCDHDIELTKPLTPKSQGELLVSLGLANRNKKKRSSDRRTRLYALKRADINRVADAYHVGVTK